MGIRLGPGIGAPGLGYARSLGACMRGKKTPCTGKEAEGHLGLA